MASRNRMMTLIAFRQTQNCSNLPGSWCHPATMLDFLNAGMLPAYRAHVGGQQDPDGVFETGRHSSTAPILRGRQASPWSELLAFGAEQGRWAVRHEHGTRRLGLGRSRGVNGGRRRPRSIRAIWRSGYARRGARRWLQSCGIAPATRLITSHNLKASWPPTLPRLRLQRAPITPSRP